MGMFDSFIGKGSNAGYTVAQSAGLRRSSQIKKRRKEEERAFTREQEATKNKAALAERRMMEAGQTGRTAMTEAGQTGRTAMTEAGQTRRTAMTAAAGIQKQKLSDVGQMARQRLTGEQQRGAATTKAYREANVKSMEYGRSLTKGEIKHEREMELQKLKNKVAPGAILNELQGNIAGGESSGGGKEYTFAQYTGLGQKEQMGYATYLKKNNPKKFKEFANQYKMLQPPKTGETVVPENETYGPGISQYSDKTYRNY